MRPSLPRSNLIGIHRARNKTPDETLSGVYCLCTNEDQWDEATLWLTYTMLTD